MRRAAAERAAALGQLDEQRRRPPALAVLAVERPDAGQHLAEAAAIGVEPVSYTHLTLPTIYSV